MLLRSTLALAFTLVASRPIAAHNGPPFPIITDKRMGPCIVSLWTHPDVGAGRFFVIVSAAPGERIPRDLKFDIGVQPVTGRLREARYHTERALENGQRRYKAWTQFDRQELWRVHLYMLTSAGNQDAVATVMVTPPGFGAWDLLFFSLPFLGVGLLWFMALKRKRARARLQRSAAAAS